MKYKTFNFYVLISLTLILFITAFFNALIDPFYIFKSPLILKINKEKPDLKKQDRITKIIELKLTPSDIDTVFLGSSTVNNGISSDYYTFINSKNAVNASFYNTDIVEINFFAERILELHPEIKRIILGLDFFCFSEYKRKSYEFNKYKFITPLEVAQVLFSSGVLDSSLKTITYNIEKTNIPIINLDGTGIVKHENQIHELFKKYLENYINGEDLYKNYKLSSNKLNVLKNLKEKCTKNNIELILFINPVHTSQLQAIKTSGNWEQFKQWKKSLLGISDYYDFSYYDKLFDEKISPDMKYFIDSTHYSNNLGNKILDKISGKYSELGYYVTKDNIDFLNKKLDEDYDIWQLHNPKLCEYIKSLKKY